MRAYLRIAPEIAPLVVLLHAGFLREHSSKEDVFDAKSVDLRSVGKDGLDGFRSHQVRRPVEIRWPPKTRTLLHMWGSRRCLTRPCRRLPSARTTDATRLGTDGRLPTWFRKLPPCPTSVRR